MPEAHNVEIASRLADEPELTISACRTPARRASARWKRCVSGPEVSQKSRLERTSSTTSSGPNTLPDTGTTGFAGSNSAGPVALGGVGGNELEDLLRSGLHLRPRWSAGASDP